MSNARTRFSIHGKDENYRGELQVASSDLSVATQIENVGKVKTTLSITGEDKKKQRTTIHFDDYLLTLYIKGDRVDYSSSLLFDTFFRFSDNTSRYILERLIQKQSVTKEQYEQLVSSGKIEPNIWYYIYDGDILKDVYLGYNLMMSVPLDAYTKSEVDELISRVGPYYQGKGIKISTGKVISIDDEYIKSFIPAHDGYATKDYVDNQLSYAREQLLDTLHRNRTEVEKIIKDNDDAVHILIDDTNKNLEQAKSDILLVGNNLSEAKKELTEKFNLNTKRIEDAENAIEEAKAGIKDIEGDIGDVLILIDESNGRISTLETFKSTITGEVNTISTDLDAAKASIELNATSINTLDGKIGDVGIRMSAAEGTIEAHASAIDTANKTIGEVKTIADANTASITSITTWQDSTDGRILTAEGKISASEGKIEDVIKSIATETGRIDTLRSEMDGINLTIINVIDQQIQSEDSTLTKQVGVIIDGKTDTIESSIKAIQEGTDESVTTWVGQKISAGTESIKTAIEKEIADAGYVDSSAVGTIIDGKKDEITNYVIDSKTFTDAATGISTSLIGSAKTEWGIDSITSTVSQIEQSLTEDGKLIDSVSRFSTIEQDLNGVIIAVGNEDSGIIKELSTISVKQGEIVASIENGDNYAAIVARLNDDTSSITIKADKINLDGDTIASRLTAAEATVGNLTLTNASVYGIIASGKEDNPAWILKPDGSGSLASGNISWTKNGVLTLGRDIEVGAGGLQLGTISEIASFFELITNDGNPYIHVKNNYGFVSDSFVSAGGKNDSGGGQGGASAIRFDFTFSSEGVNGVYRTSETTDGVFDSMNLVTSLYDDLYRLVMAEIFIQKHTSGGYFIEVRTSKYESGRQYHLVVVQ